MPSYAVGSGSISSSIGSAATSSTISTMSTTPMFPTKTVQVSGYLEDFFENIFSAFDRFAQVVNLVYLIHPMPERNVSFDAIIRRLLSAPSSADSIKTLLQGCQRSYLNMQANEYRNCSFHRRGIDFRPVTYVDPYSAVPSLRIAEILLPDDPSAPTPTYLKKIDARVFGERVFKHTLAVIDSAYRIMKTAMTNTDQIPV